MVSETALNFKPWDVRSILIGRKTEARFIKSRRVVGDRIWVREAWSPGYSHDPDALDDIPKCGVIYLADMKEESRAAPYEIAEAWDSRYSDDGPTDPVVFGASRMPRWASRITLEVTGVRTERLHAIDDDGAKAEGIYWSETFEGWTSGAGADETCDFHRQWPTFSFRKLWATVHGEGSWAANPLVTVVQFKRVTEDPDGE